MNDRFSKNDQKQPVPPISTASIDETIRKLRVYADDAFNAGDYLVSNSLEQTITQAQTLKSEIIAASFRHDGDIPQAAWDILAQGYNQIIDRGEYLAGLANLFEQFTEINADINAEISQGSAIQDAGPIGQTNANQTARPIYPPSNVSMSWTVK